VDHPRGKKGSGGKARKNLVLIGTTRTQLPTNVPIWFGDATGRAELLGDLAGQVVHDRTPEGRLEQVQSTKQLDWDTTRGTSTSKVASMVLGVAAAHPQAKKIGLIGHQPHIKELFSDDCELLDGSNVDWEYCYFGEGPDRASNLWMDCDLLIVAGTPRPNPGSIKSRLIRGGKITAAADPKEGSWGPRRWEGRAEDGTRRIIHGLGYADLTWRQAHEDMVRAALLQAIGRGRGILDDGTPVVVLSSEPLGLDLADLSHFKQISAKVRQAAEVVRHCCGSLIENYIGKTQQPESGISTGEVAAQMGINKSGASRHLQAAQQAGLVQRAASHKGGWHPVSGGQNAHQPSPQNDDLIEVAESESPDYSREEDSESPLSPRPEHIKQPLPAKAKHLADQIGILVATDLPPP